MEIPMIRVWYYCTGASRWAVTFSRGKGQELVCWGQSVKGTPSPCPSWSRTPSTGLEGRNTGSLSPQDKKTRISGSRCRSKESVPQPPSPSGLPSSGSVSCGFHTGSRRDQGGSVGFAERMRCQRWRCWGPYGFHSSGNLTASIYPDPQLLGSLF